MMIFWCCSLLLLAAACLAAVVAHAEQELCVSEPPIKEWFPAYNASRGLVDWTATPPGWASCHAYSRATCCEKNHTDVVTRMTLLMSNAAYSEPCQTLTESVLCALACDPDVGLGHISPVKLCPGTCQAWYLACKNEFITPPAQSVYRLPITPCLDSSLVCSKVEDLFPSAPEFCHAMSVSESPSAGERQCVSLHADSKRRGTPLPKPTFASTSRPGPKSMVDQFIGDFRRLFDLVSRLYTNNVDKVVRRHPHLLLAVGAITLAFIALPLLARMWMNRRAGTEEEENDDFKQ